jgi:hypothetical protein
MRNSADRPLCTSRSRRQGAYLYDVDLYEATAPANTPSFFARVVNMVRLQSGHIVAVHAELPDQRGATLDEAFSHIEAAVEAWVAHQTPPDSATCSMVTDREDVRSEE